MPVRDSSLPYLEAVAGWHGEIAGLWAAVIDRASSPGRVALLVWGDPSLYDSTIWTNGKLDGEVEADEPFGGKANSRFCIAKVSI